MLTVRRRLSGSAFGSSGPPAAEQLVLPFELRQKSRLRARLKSGVEVGLFLERGIVLRGGDVLVAEDGTVIEVVAAPETVSTVRESEATRLARAAYHLGNRHVPVEVGSGWLRYGHDHVLDEMVRGLGLTVIVEQAPFEPEAGAYGHSHGHAQGGGHSAGDSYEPSHEPSHEHSHGHVHAHGDAHGHGSSQEHGHSHGRGFGVLLEHTHSRGHEDDHQH